MEQAKPVVLGKITAEELAQFNQLRFRAQAINAMLDAMVKSTLNAAAAERKLLVEETDVLWKKISAAYPLDDRKLYAINHRTGEITEEEQQQHPFAAVLGALNLPDGGDDTATEHKTVN